MKLNKEVFFELREHIFLKDVYKHINEVKISSLSNPNIVDEIKTLNVIKLDNLESFSSYINYDYFLIFKFKDDYYFCDTELFPSLGIFSLVKIVDYNLYLRKDKMKNLNKKSN
jgi:hypothetical protein